MRLRPPKRRPRVRLSPASSCSSTSTRRSSIISSSATLGNREDAEDLVQDTFIKAFRNFDRYDRKYTFYTWLYTIARRTVYNHYRGKRETQTIEFEIIDAGATPDSQTEASDLKRSIWNLAKELKPEYQEVLILKYSDDLSVKEIAQVMNKSLVNIKTLLFRARQQLRKIDHNKLLSR